MSNQYDLLIEEITSKLFPQCDWRLIKAQVKQESFFNPTAQSPCGARGLLQIIPETGEEMGYTHDELWDPQNNLTCGIKYLREQYRHFPEIPDHAERLKFSLAAYNGGRGYINMALRLGYQFEHGVFMHYKSLKPGRWQQWLYAKEKLKSSQCFITEDDVMKRPDWQQIIGYVGAIWQSYMEYIRVNREGKKDG